MPIVGWGREHQLHLYKKTRAWKTNVCGPVRVLPHLCLCLQCWLVAALPVPANENFRASLAAITNFSLSKWVPEVRAASKSHVRFTPGGHVAFEDVHHTLGNFEFTFLSSVFASSYFRVMTKRGCHVPCHSCHKTASEPRHADSHCTRYRLEKGEMIAELLSMCRVTTRLRGNRQGERVRMTVSALDVLSDR